MANSAISFEVKTGQKLGLIGANGSGKTTLLNVLAGYLKPDGGRIVFLGHDTRGWRPDQLCRLGISRTWQNFRLFLKMTVLENVLIGTSLHTPHLGQAESVARELIDKVGLSEKILALASTLSTGQRKRLELARCLATRPKLMLLDEPLAGVDPGNRQQIIDLLGRIMSTGSVTTILVEHDPLVIRQLCDRAIALVTGTIVADGAPANVYDSPEVRASYLGGPGA